MKIKAKPWAFKIKKYSSGSLSCWERLFGENNYPIARIVEICISGENKKEYFCSVSNCFVSEHHFSYTKTFDSIYRSIFWCDIVLTSNDIILEDPFVFLYK